MLIQIFLSLFFGTIAGTFAGLAPGIHINLIGVLLVTLSASTLSFVHPIYLVVFVVAMAITQTFVDFIPGIFLGCPDTDTELSVLPGHELLKEGEGYQAILLTAYGCLTAIILLLIITYPLILLVSWTYKAIESLIPYILILISVILILMESKRINATLVFVLTGILGVCILNLPESILKQPLLPLLTGLFGSSMLIMSIKNKTKIPEQKIIKPKLTKESIRPILGALIASPLCGFLPGLGSGQAAVIGNTISNTKDNKKNFLILLGATNALVMGFSFISLYTISKTRTGAALTIKQVLGEMNPQILILILGMIIISGIISFFLTDFLAKFFSQKINKINYSLLSIATIVLLFVVILFVSGFFGIIVLLISTMTGIFCISLCVRRTNMMACILLPVILWYLF